MSFIAKTSYGLEDVLATELSELGASNIFKLRRAVSFECDLRTLYKINLYSRVALRVLKPLFSFNLKNENELYTEVRKYRWDRLISVKQTFAINSVVNSDNFNHSNYVALKTKDAIVDQIRDLKGSRPDVELNDPDFRIDVHIFDDKCNISLDSSGRSLHKRGYRAQGHEAPLNEVLAAGMIALSEWDGKSSLLDPMCGSGTLAVEAAMKIHRIAPGSVKPDFGFMRWKNFDQDLWEEVVQEAEDQFVDQEDLIFACDIDENSVELTEQSLANVEAPLDINVIHADFFDLEKPTDHGTIIMNPPYGERLEQDEINDFYKEIGNKLKRDFAGWNAWILSSNAEALKFIGLKPSRKIKLYNGSLECKFQKFTLYDGSKKAKKQKRS